MRKIRLIACLTALCLLLSSCGLAELIPTKPAETAASSATAAESREESSAESTAPAPTEPAPTEPAPTEPAPTVPAPTEPEPVPIAQPLTLSGESEASCDWNSSYTAYYSRFSFSRVELCEADAGAYPKLNEALAFWQTNRHDGFALPHYDYIKLEAPAYNAATHDILYYIADCTAVRADDRVCSLVMSEAYKESDGIPRLDITGRVLDPASGEALAPAQVVRDMEQLKAALLAEGKKLGAGEAQLETYFAEIRDKDFQSVSWSVTNGSLDFYVSEKALGLSDSDRAAMISIPFSAYPELVKPEYAAVPESYMQTLLRTGPMSYACPRSDVPDVEGITDGFGSISAIRLHICRDELPSKDLPLFSYDFYPVLMHAADGSEYLYLTLVADNDIRFTDIVKLPDCSILSEEATYLCAPDDAAGVRGNGRVITDTAQLPMAKHTDLCGTATLFGTYGLQTDGKCKLLYAVLSYVHPQEMTLKKEFSFVLTDSSAARKENVTLPAGTKLTRLLATEDDFVIFRAEDGRLVGLQIDTSWPQTVDGETLTDILDGVIFAG